jgi:hypothetical protein
MTTDLCYTLLHEAVKDETIKKLLSSTDSGDKGIGIECRPCGADGAEGNARAFCQRNPWSVTLCTNRLVNLDDIRESLRHELVHVFDFSSKRYDYTNCKGLAASEIRAAREAECVGRFAFGFLKERCIRTHAERSTANIFPKDAESCIAAMYAICSFHHSTAPQPALFAQP